jgi:hypothetical protein
MYVMLIISVVKLTISVASQILSNSWLHDERTQNSVQGSIMNFKIYSPKNCHYEKIRFILIWHHVHSFIHV